MYVAHTREIDENKQSVIEHLSNTAALAGKFCDGFGNGEYGRLCGILHDIGKYSGTFQKKINTQSNAHVDHSTAGAVEADKVFKDFGRIISYCVAGHHGGLPDGGTRLSDTESESTLIGRLKRAGSIPDYSNYKNELDLNEFMPKKPIRLYPIKEGGFTLSFYIRMLYSALVDADFLDTEAFMWAGRIDRKTDADFSAFLSALNKRILKFEGAEGAINKKRREILQSCIKKSGSDRGLYSLTVPTGGGKTVSSLAFAVNHVIKHGMDRIIYVIPYTSILEQNAGVFKGIIGDEYVLEHHSNFDFNKDDEKMVIQKQKLASENWDVPVVVTTNVQFFESLLANKSSKCRKLHNISNSVIIFDEAQMIPVQYLTPCIMAISELVANYNSTCVLCSATQPAIEDKFPKDIQIEEICEHTEETYEFFRRVEVIKRGRMDVADIAGEMKAERQCLCVVNNKKHALAVYKEIDSENAFYLTTRMCPAHRKKVIEEIKRRISKNEECRVVSTQLIEAGVDVDFPVVYRSLAGIDSIVQAAGRCNREGRLETGLVYVFEPESEYVSTLSTSLKRPMEIAKEIIAEYDDIISMPAIREYFIRLYELEKLDKGKIFKRFEDGAENLLFPFKSVANDFKLIDEDTFPVIIPYDDEAKRLLNNLKYAENRYRIIRSLQRVTVNIYENEFKAMIGGGMLDEVDDGIYVLRDMNLYNEKTGLDITSKTGIGIFV